MNYIQENFAKFVPEISRYNNGRVAVQYNILADEEPWKSMGMMEPACMATINLPHEHLEEDEVIIKDYSENQGLYDCMLAAGHIGPELRRVSSGFITAPVCKLLLDHQKL